jgi:nicotinamide riboside transporter PnuC
VAWGGFHPILQFVFNPRKHLVLALWHSLLPLWYGGFFYIQLYGQMFLYLFYAAMGIYGWWYWKQAEKKNIHIINWSIQKKVWVLASGVVLSAISYFIVINSHFLLFIQYFFLGKILMSFFIFDIR